MLKPKPILILTQSQNNWSNLIKNRRCLKFCLYRINILNILPGKKLMISIAMIHGANYVKNFMIPMNLPRYIKTWQSGFIMMKTLIFPYVLMGQKDPIFCLCLEQILNWFKKNKKSLLIHWYWWEIVWYRIHFWHTRS